MPPQAAHHTRKYKDEDATDPNWLLHEKHVFILSNAGKPIYSRYGDETKLSGTMGVLQAIVSFLKDTNDNIQSIVAGKFKFVFLLKGSIYLVCVSQTSESVNELTRQLNMMYLQIVSILTGGFEKIFKTKNNFDLRSLLGGTDKFLDQLMYTMDQDLAALYDGVRVLRMSNSARTNIGNVIVNTIQERNANILYAIVLAKDQLVTLCRPRKHLFHPADLQLIVNFILASESLKASESWTPICLPEFNSNGFLYAFINFITPECCLLLISTQADQDQFYACYECRNAIVKGLTSLNLLQAINIAYENHLYSAADTGVSVIRHFVYKSSTQQVTSPALEAPYHLQKERKRLFRLYQHVYSRAHQDAAKPFKCYWVAGEYEIIFSWITPLFELMVAFPPLVTKKMGINAANKLLRWIKKEEESLFIVSPPMIKK